MKQLSNNPGHGVLFRVRDKQSEKGPDLKGGLNLDGVEYELAVWERESKRGQPYFSISISLPRDQAPVTERPPQDDGDIPFGNEPASRVDDDALRQQANRSFTDASKSRRW
jgi:hypothetical protein